MHRTSFGYVPVRPLALLLVDPQQTPDLSLELSQFHQLYLSSSAFDPTERITNSVVIWKET